MASREDLEGRLGVIRSQIKNISTLVGELNALPEEETEEPLAMAQREVARAYTMETLIYRTILPVCVCGD